jgi:hypothetical protein
MPSAPTKNRKPPRPASTYRGARRNALKRGEKLTAHRWQIKPPYAGKKYSRFGTEVLEDGALDGSFKGVIRENARVLR